MAIRWFCELCYGVVGSEGYTNFSVLKQVGDSAHVWGGKSEGCQFGLFSVLVGGVARIVLCIIWCFDLLRSVVGNLFFFLQRGGWFAIHRVVGHC